MNPRAMLSMSSAVTWSGALAWLTLSTPRARRGQTLGTAFGFAVLVGVPFGVRAAARPDQR